MVTFSISELVTLEEMVQCTPKGGGKKIIQYTFVFVRTSFSSSQNKKKIETLSPFPLHFFKVGTNNPPQKKPTIASTETSVIFSLIYANNWLLLK